MRFSTYDLLSICFVIVLALTLTTQDAYDRGNESSKLVSIIIFGGLQNLQSLLSFAKGLSFTFMLSIHLLPDKGIANRARYLNTPEAH
jgi:hypothetical protein